jgi:hypothetical protein
MTRTSYSRQATFSEVFGLVVGGGALIAVLAAQLLFVAWML